MDTKTGQLSPPDAIAAICMCAMQSDSKIKPVEVKKLASMIAMSPLYRSVEDPIGYLSELNRSLGGTEVGGVLERSIEALSPSLRETAYAWACQIVAADQGFSQEEHACLSLLVKKMGLHGELAGKIAAVVAILNRKA